MSEFWVVAFKLTACIMVWEYGNLCHRCRRIEKKLDELLKEGDDNER